MPQTTVNDGPNLSLALGATQGRAISPTSGRAFTTRADWTNWITQGWGKLETKDLQD